MAKTAIFKSLYRSISCRSYTIRVSSESLLHQQRHYVAGSFFNFSFHRRSVPDSHPHQRFPRGIWSTRFFSGDFSQMPVSKDPELQNIFKYLMSGSWDNLPEPVIYEASEVLSRDTYDKAGKEVVENVFRASEAVEEFTGILVNLKIEIDDIVGLSGENVQPLSDGLTNALRTVYDRYITYLDAFGLEETYLRKKVETELGIKMIHLKMRCGGLGSDWGKAINHNLQAGTGAILQGPYAPTFMGGQPRSIGMAPQLVPVGGGLGLDIDMPGYDDEEMMKLRAERGGKAGGWSVEFSRRRAFDEAFGSLWTH